MAGTDDEPDSDDEGRGRSGSGANIPLAISGVLLLMTGFIASMPGGFWQMYGVSAAFALWGLMEAERRAKRMIALVLLAVSGTCGVMDLLVDLAGR